MPGWWDLLHVDGSELRPGASTKALDAAEAALAIPLPQELRSLYRASDGVFDAVGQWFVVWPLDVLVDENVRRRENGVLPESMIGFGDDGAGNPFCVEEGQSSVSCWYVLEDRKEPLAVDIATFWRGWTGGTITT
jgi:hypothetical protein